MNPLVTVRGLSKRYGRQHVLDALGLELHADQICVLLGSNGVGKSTLLRSLIGLEDVRADTLEVLGVDPRRKPDALRRLVGWVPDHSDVPAWMTPAECARFQQHCYDGWDSSRLAQLFDRLDVPTKRAFAKLSRGEAAKAMLALALASRPKLLILDEPLARLDPRTKDEVLACLLAEVPIDGGACLLATHDLDVAVRAADRVLVLANGRVECAVDVANFDPTQTTPGGLRARLVRLYDPTPLELAR
jgi:ABC-2 type transport system ATP-binding protein